MAIDIGNTQIKAAFFDNDHIAERWVLTTPFETLPSTFVECYRKCESHGIVSVVPKQLDQIQDALAALNLPMPHRIAPLHDLSIKHTLETPETTGADRLLAAYAARHRADRRDLPIIVIQAGTAVTVDLIDSSGIFRGGFILPGPDLWLKALSSAACLPALSAENMPAPQEAGPSTNKAIIGGLSLGLPAAIVECIALLSRNESTEPACVLTGGYGELLKSGLPDSVSFIPDLVLHGVRLACLAIANRE